MFLWCAMITGPVNSCQILCVTNYLKIKRLMKCVSSSCSRVCGVVGLGEVWLCSCAWGCGLPTPAHSGAPGEEAVALAGISWQPSGMHACICKCMRSLCLYTSLTSHCPNRLTPKPRNHIQGTNLDWYFSLWHMVSNSLLWGKRWLERGKKNQCQHYLPVWWEK